MGRADLAGMFLVLAICGCGGTPVDEITAAANAASGEPLPTPSENDWPWWRGISLDGKTSAQNLPTEWSPAQNVIWQADVPGSGHASPTIWGDQVFISTADEAAEVMSLLSYDRPTGRQRWKVDLHSGGFMHRHGKNSHASATPACDGRQVYVPHMVQDALWVSAVDLQGRLAWQTKAGPFSSQHGYGSSPALYQSLVIVCGDNPGSGFLAALDRASGKIVWRVRRESGGNYATPMVCEVAGRQQLLIGGTGVVSSYNPDTGERLWYCDGPSQVMACTMAFGKDLVYASGGYPEKEILCIRADGSGDVTDTHIVWRSTQGVAYVPSPLLVGDALYVLSDNGVLTCFEAQTGKVRWRERLGGDFSASMVLAGELGFVPDEDGVTHVFRLGEKFQHLGKNNLGDGGFASPVICGDRIYLRTSSKLYCVGKS
jgi:hypothetical protein